MSGADAVTRASHDGRGLRIGVLRTRWHADLLDRLEVGVRASLDAAQVTTQVHETVAGSLELPFGAQALARSGAVDAVVALGVVIRGATTHYELVSNEACRGLQHVQLTSGIPVGFGVLTVENRDQALERSEPPPGHNVGRDAADAAIELALLARRFEPNDCAARR